MLLVGLIWTSKRVDMTDVRFHLNWLRPYLALIMPEIRLIWTKVRDQEGPTNEVFDGNLAAIHRALTISDKATNVTSCVWGTRSLLNYTNFWGKRWSLLSPMKLYRIPRKWNQVNAVIFLYGLQQWLLRFASSYEEHSYQKGQGRRIYWLCQKMPLTKRIRHPFLPTRASQSPAEPTKRALLVQVYNRLSW